ncbi:MAG: RdgB/HAM1 family non-canonical purine NTP pyrophosphatase [Fibrobacter sp.]|nr:RdgB/HAM1 family non-canonical purine NTP pyrophosphatase [Fibrobacter sp.]
MNKQVFIVATANAGKLREFSQALGTEYYDFKTMQEMGFEREILENGESFAENSLIKAKTVYDFLREKGIKVAVLADDSGLAVQALDGAPGVHSARYAGPEATDADNNAKLLHELTSQTNRGASFVCWLSYIDSTGEVYQFKGECPGTILHAPQGEQGFGYDPLFQPNGFAQSFAEMSVEQKRVLSHRGQAISLLEQFLQSP